MFCRTVYIHYMDIQKEGVFKHLPSPLKPLKTYNYDTVWYIFCKKNNFPIDHHHHQSVLPKGRSFTASTGLSCSSVEGSFSNLSVTSPTSQLIFQPFRRFTYVTGHSPTLLLLHLRHSSFSNPYFAFPTSQALHLRHLASRP